MAHEGGYECLHDPACRVLAWPRRDHSVRCAESNANSEAGDRDRAEFPWVPVEEGDGW